jgi:hypothetical protein
MRRISALALGWLPVSAAAVLAFAQLSPSATWAAHAVNDYQVIPNVTYLVASNYESN